MLVEKIRYSLPLAQAQSCLYVWDFTSLLLWDVTAYPKDV